MLEQVIMNLAVNARDAMPKGGQLLITTSSSEIDETYVHDHPDARICTALCLAVTDTGMGMDEATLQRIFEPFFTTKPVGKGTGLGLATVYGIVKQHQGWIEVQSQVGRGTTFKIYLPASTRSLPEDHRNSDHQEVSMGQNETVLLVEDEFSLRLWVKEILTANRYNVIEAASGVDALRIWDEQNGKIDLLLTDMVMPEGLTGGDLARQLKIRKPPLKVIYTSGYSSEILGNHSELPEGPFLPKPFPAPQLVRLVRECLDSSPAVKAAAAKN
jgi:CheY-like chemotaxis protein